jgi:hypothetical protein
MRTPTRVFAKAMAEVYLRFDMPSILEWAAQDGRGHYPATTWANDP